MKTTRIKKPKLSKVLNLGKVQMAAKQMVVATMMVSMVAMPYSTQAGFLDEYVEGASVNTSQPGYVQSSSLNLVTGGGLVAKFPNRGFTPFTFSPPSLKAGCGGIDLYLGAFGFPTKDEMVAFLRQVGQAAGGIAFQIALKALSPQLSSTIQDFAQQITAMTNNFRDSCSAAKALYSTGPGLATGEAIYNAFSALRLTNSDETASNANTQNWETAANSILGPNAARALGGKTNPATGQVMPAKPLNKNITWDALNSDSRLGFSTSIEPSKHIILNMLGTVIYLSDNNPATPGQSETDSEGRPINSAPTVGGGIKGIPIEAALSPSDGINLLLYGRRVTTEGQALGSNPQFMVCKPLDSDDPGCLTPARVSYSEFQERALVGVDDGLQGIFQKAARTVITGIQTRTQSPDFGKSVQILGGASEFDLVKAVNLAGSIKYGSLATNLVDNLVILAAKNTAARFIESAIDASIREIDASKKGVDSKTSTDAYKEVQDRIVQIRQVVAEDRASTRQYMNNIMAQASYLRDIERSLTADLNVQLAQNLSFSTAR